ncbi:hypothetical protein BESB_043790 [Besnoitia besnoiti]|uniref:Uncharacterized protein n=1 Tax=Besnoitia besnoiti TaxID=94643 RepID=A0A2A9MKN7_BESBE|nr:hypothetical protein BESB_043790 [Besnoitia besnoiti]PFH36187.1 hypothetical protein BESB_043790 [Besnoitia besnoiti]
MANLQASYVEGSSGLDTPIPASIVYDPELSKIFSALAAPLLQSQGGQLPGSVPASASGQTTCAESTPRSQVDLFSLASPAERARRDRQGFCEKSAARTSTCAETADDLARALQALAGHLTELAENELSGSPASRPSAYSFGGASDVNPELKADEDSRQTRTRSSLSAGNAGALSQAASVAEAASTRTTGSRASESPRATGGIGQRQEKSSRKPRLNLRGGQGQSLRPASPDAMDARGRASKRPASDTLVEGDVSPTGSEVSSHLSSEKTYEESCKSPKVREGDSPRCGGRVCCYSDRLLQKDLEDVLQLERATSRLLLDCPQLTPASLQDISVKTWPHRSQLNLPLPSRGVPLDGLASSRPSALAHPSKLESPSQATSPTSSSVPCMLPKSFRSRSDYLSLCSLQTGMSEMEKEREPRSLDELKSLGGDEVLGLTEIHMLAESLAKEFMESSCPRLSPDDSPSCRLKYRRDNLSFTVLPSKGQTGSDSPSAVFRLDGRRERSPSRSSKKDVAAPWSAGGMFIAPYASGGSSSAFFAGNASGWRGTLGASPINHAGESGVNDSTVGAVVSAFLKATSIVAETAAEQLREMPSLGTDAGLRQKFMPWLNSKAEGQLESFRRTA